MKKYTVCTVIVLTLLATGYAEEGLCLEKRVPPETLLFVSCPDISMASEAFGKTALYQIGEEEEMRQFVEALTAPLSKEIDKFFQKFEKEIGIAPRELAGIFHGELSLALVSFDPNRGTAGVLVAIEFGPNRDAFEKLLKKSAKAGFKTEEKKKGSHKIFLLKSKDIPIPLCYAYAGNTFVLSTDPDLLVNSLKTDQGACLADSPDFKTARQKLTGEKGTPAFFGYVNLRQISAQFAPMIPPDAQEIMNALGVFNIVTLAFTTNFCGEYMYDGIFIGITGERLGITKLLHGGPASMNFAREAPKDAVAFVAYHLDPAKLIREIEEIVRLADPSGQAFEGYQMGYADLEKMLGFSLIDDVAASMGSDHSTFQYLPPSGAIMPVAIGMSEIKDLARFLKWTSQLATLMNLKLETTTFQGQTIYYLSPPLGRLGEEPFRNFNNMDPVKAALIAMGYNLSGLGFMPEKGRLYYGNAQDLKSFLRHRGEWREFLSSSECFQKAVGSVSSGGSLIVYQDFRPTAMHLWNGLLLPLSRLAEGVLRDAGIPFESALIPQAATVSRHLIPGATSYVSDKDGVLLESYSATGSILYIAPVTAVVAAIAIPGLLKARMEANEASAKATLRSVTTAQAMFQMEAAVDQDQDGTGEYGYLQELQGTAVLRGKDERLSRPYIAGMGFHKGVGQKSGYNFYCYLPGKDRATGEDSMNPTTDEDEINLQENRYIIYAWPVKNGETGRSAFAITQSGELYQCEDHSYFGRNRPNPEDVFSKTSDNAKNLEGNIAEWEYGYNDSFWRPAY